MIFRSQQRYQATQFLGNAPLALGGDLGRVILCVPGDRDAGDPSIRFQTTAREGGFQYVPIGSWVVDEIPSAPTDHSDPCKRWIMSDAEFRKQFQADDHPVQAGDDPRAIALRLKIALANLQQAVEPLRLFAEAGKQSAEDRAAADRDATGLPGMEYCLACGYTVTDCKCADGPTPR